MTTTTMTTTAMTRTIGLAKSIRAEDGAAWSRLDDGAAWLPLDDGAAWSPLDDGVPKSPLGAFTGNSVEANYFQFGNSTRIPDLGSASGRGETTANTGEKEVENPIATIRFILIAAPAMTGDFFFVFFMFFWLTYDLSFLYS